MSQRVRVIIVIIITTVDMNTLYIVLAHRFVLHHHHHHPLSNRSLYNHRLNHIIYASNKLVPCLCHIARYFDHLLKQRTQTRTTKKFIQQIKVGRRSGIARKMYLAITTARLFRFFASVRPFVASVVIQAFLWGPGRQRPARLIVKSLLI